MLFLVNHTSYFQQARNYFVIQCQPSLVFANHSSDFTREEVSTMHSYAILNKMTADVKPMHI